MHTHTQTPVTHPVSSGEHHPWVQPERTVPEVQEALKEQGWPCRQAERITVPACPRGGGARGRGRRPGGDRNQEGQIESLGDLGECGDITMGLGGVMQMQSEAVEGVSLKGNIVDCDFVVFLNSFQFCNEFLVAKPVLVIVNALISLIC